MSRKNLGPQVLLLFGEAFVLLVSGTFLYLLISRIAGAELLGQYALVLAWLVLFQSLANFGLPEFLMRDVGRGRHPSAMYAVHGLVIGAATSLISLVAMSALVTVFGYSSELRHALLLGALTLPPVMATSICRATFLAHKDAHWILVVALAEFVLVVPVNSYFIVTGNGILFLVSTLVAGKLLSCVVSLALLHRSTARLRWRLDMAFGRGLLAPLGVFFASNLLGLLSMRLNVIMLSALGGIASVGLYAAASKITEMALMIPSVFAQILLPHFSRALATEPTPRVAPEARIVRSLFAVVVVIAGGVLLFADSLVQALFGSQFDASAPILRVLALYFMIESAEAMMGMILKAAGQQGADVRMYSANVAVNVALNLLLIPPLGGLGAALAKLGGGLSSSGLRWAFISRRLFALNWARIVMRPALLTSILVGGLSLLHGRLPVLVLALVYSVVGVWVFYRSLGGSVRDLRGLIAAPVASER